MEIKDFFKRYASAFSERNLAAIVSFYSFPTAFYLEDGTSNLMDELEFYENGKELISMYDGLGMESVNFRIISVIQINSSSSLLEIEWSLLNSNGGKIVSFDTRYIVSAQNNEFKILGVFVVNERETISALTQAQDKEDAH